MRRVASVLAIIGLIVLVVGVLSTFAVMYAKWGVLGLVGGFFLLPVTVFCGPIVAIMDYGVEGPAVWTYGAMGVLAVSGWLNKG